ncbi:MAG: chaperonin GroEL [Nanoarchaeota archaeon]|nr:chaperonin GroEL [Nanoarchaeota archaeon]
MIKHAFNPELSQKLLEGIRKLSDLVSVSLGPRGQTVLISLKDRVPFATKDGYNIARMFFLDDDYEDLGSRIAKEASQKNAEIAGDGSTSVIVLLNAILQLSQRYLVAGAFPIDIKSGIEKLNKHLLETLARDAKKIKSKEDIFHIASISANNDPVIGEIVSEAIDLIGKDGSLLIEDSKSFETILKVVEGFTFDSGFTSMEFVNNERKQSVSYENPLFFITDYKIGSVQEMIPTLELVARDGRPLVVVAEEVHDQAMAAFIANAIRGTMKVVVIKAPKYGVEKRNILSDLALTVGATFITRESGMRLKDVKLENFGSAKSIEVLKNSTTIVDGKGKQEKIQERIEMLKEEIKQTESIEEAKRIQERITRLASGIAIIYVGGNSEIEAMEKKHRIEDSVEASRSAIEKGITEGGGVTLMRLALSKETEEFIESNAKNEDEKFGMIILKKAIQEPFKKILSNAGLNHELIMRDCNFDQGIGYDSANNKFVNMMDAGIIDPVKVISCALLHSVSVATSIIMSKAAILEK